MHSHAEIAAIFQNMMHERKKGNLFSTPPEWVTELCPACEDACTTFMMVMFIIPNFLKP